MPGLSLEKVAQPTRLALLFRNLHIRLKLCKRRVGRWRFKRCPMILTNVLQRSVNVLSPKHTLNMDWQRKIQCTCSSQGPKQTSKKGVGIDHLNFEQQLEPNHLKIIIPLSLDGQSKRNVQPPTRFVGSTGRIDHIYRLMDLQIWLIPSGLPMEVRAAPKKGALQEIRWRENNQRRQNPSFLWSNSSIVGLSDWVCIFCGLHNLKSIEIPVFPWSKSAKSAFSRWFVPVIPVTHTPRAPRCPCQRSDPRLSPNGPRRRPRCSRPAGVLPIHRGNSHEIQWVFGVWEILWEILWVFGDYYIYIYMIIYIYIWLYIMGK